MSIGRDMYDQQCIEEFLYSDDWCNSRSDAIDAATAAINPIECDFPTGELVTMALTNHERGRILLDYCRKTRFIPWFIAKKHIPDLKIKSIHHTD